MAENEIIPRLFGSYLLTERLGSDALGKVYRARKIEDRSSFFRLRIFEAAGLDSEPVLIAIEQTGAVHDFLKNPAVSREVELDSVEGDAYLAYREAGGRTLDELMALCHSRPSPIPTEHALLIAEKVATGLDHAYNSMIDGERTLHGLVWPGFVEISDEGETRLAGFGIAEGVLASRTTPAVQSLLFPYLAPEVREFGNPSKSGDVYSTAAILFALLTGAPPPLSRASEACATARMFGDPETIPFEIATVLKAALSEVPDVRYENAGQLRRELGKLLFSGKYAPSTFNFAFFLTNLLKEEIAREQAHRQGESAMEASKYPRPTATPRPPRVVAMPRFGVPVAKVEEAPEKKSAGPKVAIGIGVLALIGVLAYLFSLKAAKVVPKPVVPPPAAASPAAAPAAPTAGMSEGEFKNEVARRLSEELKKMEAEQKAKQARAETQSRIASLKPMPAPLSPGVTVLKPIPQPPPSGPAARAVSSAPPTPSSVSARTSPSPVDTRSVAPPANLPRPTPVPIPISPPSESTVKRGDLVALTEVDRQPVIATIVKPEYPEIARRVRASGTVILSVLITETGKVGDLRVIREAGGSSGLTQAAVKAVRQWTFSPAMKNGVPVKTWFTVPIPFVL
jgi:protein TonB